MAKGKNEVTLTFAGDSKKLEKAFDSVGASAKTMGTDVGSASTKISDSGGSFDRAAEGADNAEGKAQGFASTLTGTKDTAAGLGEIMRGNLFEGFVMVGQGAADLAEGFNYTVIPAAKAAASAFTEQGAATVKATASSVGHKIAMIAGTVATVAMTVATWALNTAIAVLTSPITLIVVGVAALAAGLIYAYRHSETFRNIVQGAMRGVQTAFGWVLDKGGEVLGWFSSLPGKIGGFLSGVADTISAPFRNAFAGIKSAWNSTVGGKGFTVPSWVPGGIGGKEFRIPTLHTGGIVPGTPGSETLALLQAGERVIPVGTSVPTQMAPSFEVHVFIGDQEIKGMVRAEIREKDRNTRRAVTAGASQAVA